MECRGGEIDSLPLLFIMSQQNSETKINSGTAALFIDWENFKYSLYEVSRLPDIAALLRTVRQRYGRPVIARAFADWQDYYHRRSWDQMNLYHAGVEPVYVPTRKSPFGQDRIKNSVDVRMSLDCLEVAMAHPEIETFVLVAGDADFLHVVAALHRRGVKVVMVGVSGSTSGRLADAVDEMVFYDQEIDRETQVMDKEAMPEPASVREDALPETATVLPLPPPVVRSAPPPPTPRPEPTLEAAQDTLVRLVREQRDLEGGRNYPPLLSWLGIQMRDRLPRFTLEKHGFTRLKELTLSMQSQGLLLVEAQGMVDRVWLPEDEAQVAKPPPIPPALAAALAEPDDIPDYQRNDFADIVLTASDIQNSHREYMAKGLLARFLYNKGHWDPADLPPQAAPLRSAEWRYREPSEIHKVIEDTLDRGVLRYVDYEEADGNKIPNVLELDSAHPFVRKTLAEDQMRR